MSKLCSHVDVPSDTRIFLGSVQRHDSCEQTFRDKIAMQEHHDTGFVQTSDGTKVVLAFTNHINPVTKSHDPEVCLIEEEIIDIGM